MGVLVVPVADRLAPDVGNALLVDVRVTVVAEGGGAREGKDLSWSISLWTQLTLPLPLPVSSQR